MPYRIDIFHPPPDALDILIDLGALDAEPVRDGLAAIMPDGLPPDTVARALGGTAVTASAAVARDNGSVWILTPRSVQIGSLVIAPPEALASPNTLRLTDSNAFGTGHHATTGLCIEALEELLPMERVESILDVGTGSGILALAGLMLGVRQAVGIDVDPGALEVAANNARLNHLEDRLQLVLGSPDDVNGVWPLVVANVLAAPLIDMAPVLVRKVAGHGRLILSGISSCLEAEVRQRYQHFGMRQIKSETRAGWTTLILQASW
jgi:ribosomal protein L11 methyltransferase